MPNNFLGRGWRFPVLPGSAGGLGYVEGDDNVEQSLHILLMTQLGERVMRSDFGTRAPRLVFEPGSTQYLHLLGASRLENQARGPRAKIRAHDSFSQLRHQENVQGQR